MKATFAEPEMIVRNGKPVSVILPLKAYEALLERVGDAADVLVSRSRRGGAVETHDEVRRRTVARRRNSGRLRASLQARRFRHPRRRSEAVVGRG